MNVRRGWILLLSVVVTFVVMRTMMAFRPNADFTVAGYNVHHLFTGLVILTVCGLPLVLGRGRGRLGDVLLAGFGIGLSLALDEWVYLIATDGSNASYLLPVSFWGGVVMVGAAVLYIAILIWRRPR
ncbi:MAG TPA: hypothetical protein VGQ52_06570 [Gemmatimonadaceae bacterium]|nr:hypothetical protein [Gemmatimonadaceae bacterium]